MKEKEIKNRRPKAIIDQVGDKPTFDKEGYPTDATLKAIKEWGFEDRGNLMKFMAECWCYEEQAKETYPGLWVFATCGWSGNESLIYALMENMIWHVIDKLQLSGGFYTFAVTEPAKNRLSKKKGQIAKWAWNEPKKSKAVRMKCS